MGGGGSKANEVIINLDLICRKVGVVDLLFQPRPTTTQLDVTQSASTEERLITTLLNIRLLLNYILTLKFISNHVEMDFNLAVLKVKMDDYLYLTF